MASPKSTKKAADKVEVEPGADKRLASILKKALNTPPTHVPAKPKKVAKASSISPTAHCGVTTYS